MKKYTAAIVFTLLVGMAVNSWATTNDVLSLNIPITLKVTLSDKSKGDDTTVGGSLSYAQVQYIRAGVTGTAFQVIGNSISLLTTTNGGGTNTILQGRAIWTDISSVSDSKKFAIAFGQNVFDLAANTNLNSLASVLSNSVLFITGTATDSPKTNLSGKVVGIWRDGDTSVKGSIKSKK
jgi:hypothetical protein